MKNFVLTFLLIIHSIILFAQSDYYKKEGELSIGVKIVDRGALRNAIECVVEVRNKEYRFSPQEITEYGFRNGRVYVSKTIKINNEDKTVFLERLEEGKLTLYYYKDKNGKAYFIEKGDSLLIEIEKKKSAPNYYKNILDLLTKDCHNALDFLVQTPFRKKALTRFADKYNWCSGLPIVSFNYGVLIGYGASKPFLIEADEEYLENAVFSVDNSFHAGFFFDIPINLSNFSIHPEIYYQQNVFLSNTSYSNRDIDIIINAKSINLPVLLRYAFPTKKVRPYINVGGIFSYDFENNNMVYVAEITEGMVEIEERLAGQVYSQKQLGFVVGSGVRYYINNRNSLFGEIRYNHSFEVGQQIYSNLNLQSVIGINF